MRPYGAGPRIERRTTAVRRAPRNVLSCRGEGGYAEELGMGAGWTPAGYRQALATYYRGADAVAPGLTDWLVDRWVDPHAYRAFPSGEKPPQTIVPT